MKFLVATMIAVLGLAVCGVGTSGNANVCAKNWRSAQSGSGGSFSSLQACATSKEQFLPGVSASATHVGENESFLFNAVGFHGATPVILSYVANGQSYYSTQGHSNADGSWSTVIRFSSCAVPNVTLTLTDAFGVHASTQVSVC